MHNYSCYAKESCLGARLGRSLGDRPRRSLAAAPAVAAKKHVTTSRHRRASTPSGRSSTASPPWSPLHGCGLSVACSSCPTLRPPECAGCALPHCKFLSSPNATTHLSAFAISFSILSVNPNPFRKETTPFGIVSGLFSLHSCV